jgi:tetratricopeptide (TPR) repeat protein
MPLEESVIKPASSLNRGVFLGAVVIVLGAVAAYHNSFSGPFIFDDPGSITGNPTIRHLWPVWSTLSPPPRQTASARPLVNFSLALNYALSGEAVWSYHALNLLIHILAGLVLFGLVRRTLLEHRTSSFAPFGKRRASEDRSNTEHPTSKSTHKELSNGGRGAPTSPKLRRPGLTPQIVIPSTARNLTSSRGEPTLPKLRSLPTAFDATALALAVALLWVVHPLQTESVTYVIQRAESLMGLFYLLTLYCFVRGVENQRSESRRQKADARVQIPEKEIQNPSDFCPPPSAFWLLASVFCCLLGMATKEVMISAPLMVLLYDRTFVAGSFRAAWRRRRWLYLGLACTWLLLGYLMAPGHGGSAGFGLGITPWAYALTQCQAIIHYLKLSVWPHPLVFYYGTKVVSHLADVLPQASMLVLLVLATILGVWRRPVLGFVGGWFFAILAPSSSVVPLVTQTVAEHRMYLPLASVIVLVVAGLYRLMGRYSLAIFLALAVGLGSVTVQRNKNYRTELALWSDTVAKCPDNARACYNLGCVLRALPNRLPETIAAYENAIRNNPDFVEAHVDLGNVLLGIPGRRSDAIVQFETAVRINPGLAAPHSDLGDALLDVPGRLPDAIVQCETALRIEPDCAEAHNNLGNALAQIPERLPEAITEYRKALRLRPDYEAAHLNLGNAFYESGRFREALGEYTSAVRLQPEDAGAHTDLGDALSQIPDRLPEAMAEYRKALDLQPGSAEAHHHLGTAYFRLGRFADALGEFERAIQLRPDFAEAHANLGNTLAELGRLPEAIGQYEQALRLNPDYANARENLELARKRMKQQAR